MTRREVLEIPPSLARRYAPLRVLGRGGFGVVVLARDEQLDRDVALKLMSQQAFEDATARRRFLREAQVASLVRSRHVAEVYDVGQADGVPYLAMRYVSGVDLRGRLDEGGGALEGAEADPLMVGILEGLAACHREGVVHRDLKPENVLLDADGGAVLVDFGLARGRDQRVTATGVVLGTMGYLPPEIAVGAEFTPAGDVFAAAALYFEMRTGDLPFGDFPPVPGSPAAEGLQHGLRSHGIPAAPELDALLKRALAPRPAERPPDAGAFLVEFRAAVAADAQASREGEALQMTRTFARAATTSAPAKGQRPMAPTVSSTAVPAVPPRAPGRGVPTGLALLLLALGLGAGVWLGRLAATPEARPPVPATSPETGGLPPVPAREPLALALHALEAAAGRLDENPAVQAALALEERPAEAPQHPRDRWETWAAGNTAYWEAVVTPELRAACATLRQAPLTPKLATLVHHLLRAQYLLTRSENPQARPAYGMDERSGLRTLAARFLEVETLPGPLLPEVEQGRLERDAFRERLNLVQRAAEHLGGRWQVLRGEAQLYSPEEGIRWMPRVHITTPHGRRWLRPLEMMGKAASVFATEEIQPMWFRRTEALAPLAVPLELAPFEDELELLVSVRGWPPTVYAGLRVVGAGGEEVRLVFPSEDDDAAPGQAHPEKYYLRRLRVFAGALPPAPRLVEVSAFGLQVVATPEPCTNLGLVLQRVGS